VASERSPRSSHFPRKAILNSVQITEQLLLSTMQARDSSDHTEKDPSEDRNGNCRWTGGISTRNQITNLRIPMHKARGHNNHSMWFVTFKKAFDSISHDKLRVINSGWLWWTWDILYTWLTCWPNYTGNSSLRLKQRVHCQNCFVLREVSDKVVSFLRTCSTS